MGFGRFFLHGVTTLSLRVQFVHQVMDCTSEANASFWRAGGVCGTWQLSVGLDNGQETNTTNLTS